MNYWHEVSISLQLSGALLLLLWSFSKWSKNVLNMCFPGIIFAERKDNGDVYIGKDIVRSKVKTIILNVCAFFYIAAGYLLPIFSDDHIENQWLTLGIIVLFTIIFLICAHLIAKLVSVRWIKTDRVLTDDEIKEYNIPTYATEQEILDLLNK